jgi:Ca2+-binding EF-hand superfamily protein
MKSALSLIACSFVALSTAVEIKNTHLYQRMVRVQTQPSFSKLVQRVDAAVSSFNNLRGILLAEVSEPYQLSDEEKNEVLKDYALYDANGDGELTAEELAEGLNRESDPEVDYQFTAEDCNAYIRIFDDDYSNGLSVDEYIKLNEILNSEDIRDLIEQLFNVVDRNKDGEIDK